jgi:hypothetical protein
MEECPKMPENETVDKTVRKCVFENIGFERSNKMNIGSMESTEVLRKVFKLIRRKGVVCR